MNITTEIYGARVNQNKSWWKATLTNEKLNPPKKAEYIGHENPAINEIAQNTTLTRDEKLALARKILNGETVKPIEKKKNETTSKVCVIANELIRQGTNPSSAFKKSWEMVKKQSIELKVAGVSFGNRQEALKRLKQYDVDKIKIQLEREATNEHDKNAIQVVVSVKDKGNYIIGYIPKTLAQLLAPLIDYGKSIKATFKEVIGKYQNYHNYGLDISVSI
jgi:hypothetical protein